MEQELLFPLASKLDFSRELLQPSTQQPPKAPAPRGPPMLPLFHWWELGCAALVMEPFSFPLLEGLSRKRSAAVLQNTNHLVASRPARTCISLTRTCLLHLLGVLCLNGTGSNSSNASDSLCKQGSRRGVAPSQPGQGGTPPAGRAGRRPAAFSLQLESREQRKGKHPHAHPTHEALRSSYGLCPLVWNAWLLFMMKAERGRKLQPRCQTSTQGLQQAGSNNTAQCCFFGGWWCGFPTLWPSPPCLASIQLAA